MHRKSAYFLFLAVLGMLVIGIVMLFSTSAFARDSHGDVYFFVKTTGGLARGRSGCLHGRRPWSITISGSARGGSGSVWRSSLWRSVSCRTSDMRINGSRRWVGFGPVHISAVRVGEGRRGLFSRLVVRAL